MNWQPNEAVFQTIENYVPIRSGKYFVKVLFTTFTEVLVGTCVFPHNSDASTVLPDLANVALHKKAGQFLRNICKCNHRFFDALSYTMFAVLVAGWRRAWIILVAADASNGAIFLYVLFCAIRHLDFDRLYLRSLIVSFVASSAFSTCLNGIFGDSDDGVFWRF
jgi:hypothetical protein